MELQQPCFLVSRNYSYFFLQWLFLTQLFDSKRHRQNANVKWQHVASAGRKVFTVIFSMIAFA